MEENWAQLEMEGAQLNDKRRNRSVIQVCNSLAARAGESFSAACGSAGRQAAHRICSDSSVTPMKLLAGHIKQTAERCQGHEFVLVVQDTTAMSYKTHVATEGLGPLNDNLETRGFFTHSVIALTEEGMPLGLLHAKTWVRDPDMHGQGQKRRQRDVAEKESAKWAEGLAAVEATLPAKQRVMVVQDREGDIFSLLAAARRENTELLVRASQPRKVEVPGGSDASQRKYLFEVASKAPVVGTMVVTVPRQPGQPERKATLELRAKEIRIARPHHARADAPKESPRYWVVKGTELSPPEGEEAIEWVLLTTRCVEGKAEACRMIRYYSKRWTVERYHYTLKSGCMVEKLQVDEAHALINTVALYIPVAWRLMTITYIARTEPDKDAREVLNDEEIAVLSQREGQKIVTVRNAVWAIAKLGGFEAYRRAREPGVKVMWLGMRRLAAMTEGWRLAFAALAEGGDSDSRNRLVFYDTRLAPRRRS